jgi:hypothetical protein
VKVFAIKVVMKPLLFVLIVGTLAPSSVELVGKESSNRVPVLLELFTSEGCSSCPPADSLLEALDVNQPVAGASVIVLSEHVDYWDVGGWKDPFSSAALTSRQRDYNRRFHLDGVYTPQMVVDGQAELVGSRVAQAREAIEKAARRPKTPLDIVLTGRDSRSLTVRVGFQSMGSSDGTVFVALAEGHVESQVGGGENSRRHLRHVAAVRALIPAGTVRAREPFSKQVNLSIPLGAGKGGWRVVAFVQERSSGRVLGAAQLSL